MAKKYNFQVIDLHYLLRKCAQYRCKDGMHYEALIHREITTHIAHYISCGIKKHSESQSQDNKDDRTICDDVLKMMIDKIDYQISAYDREILSRRRPLIMDYDFMENLNEKERDVLHLIDYYENKSFP